MINFGAKFGPNIQKTLSTKGDNYYKNVDSAKKAIEAVGNPDDVADTVYIKGRGNVVMLNGKATKNQFFWGVDCASYFDQFKKIILAEYKNDGTAADIHHGIALNANTLEMGRGIAGKTVEEIKETYSD